MGSIADPDVQILASVAATIASDYQPAIDDPWIGSPFQWLLSLSSRTKGAVGEALVAGWCAAKGFDVTRSKHSDADRIIHGHRVEIKLSTLWKSGGFKFQQIRNQEYDYLFCLGISPFDAQAWLLPKEVLLEHVIGHMGQHTGATGSDTAWLGFPATIPFKWMQPYGGRLAQIAFTLESTEHGPY